MIDLHNHILPGVDDGAADIDESLAIARQFLSEGVRRIAATPHFNPLESDRLEAEAVTERVESLRGALTRAGIDLEVVPGQEIFLTPDVPDLLAAGTARPLGDSRAVLVEVSFHQFPPYVDETLYRLQAAGYRPILAHPERYSFVHHDPKTAVSIAERGVALQLTAPALLGQYGRSVQRIAERLLRAGAYSLASSDRHGPGSNRSLAAVRRRLIEIGGDALAEVLLVANPARVLAGERLAPVEPVQGEESFLRRLFWM